MKSRIFIGVLTVLLCFEFALAAYSILTHEWIGLAIVTILIFGVMYFLDREVRQMKEQTNPARSQHETRTDSPSR